MKPAVAAALQQAALHEREGRLDDAKAACEKALRRDPRDPYALYSLAMLEERTGRLDRAVQLLRRTVAVQPGHVDAVVNLGIALQQQGQAGAALEQFSRAVALAPRNPAARSNHGAALLILRRPAEALAAFDDVLAAQPGNMDALANRGAALLQLQRPQEALACWEQVAAARPGQADAHANRGLALFNLQRTDEALACFERALRLHPGHRVSLVAAGECHLLLGVLPPGFRSQLAGLPQAAPLPGVPTWTGHEDVAGKTMLLYPQQGLGDTVQFCRYAPLLAARGAAVVLQVQPPLLPVMATLDGPHRLVPQGAPLPPCDLQCGLMALPAAFGTALDGVPGVVPYLMADPGRVGAWSARLGPRSRPRVGLAWSGNADHLNDHNRSMPFAALRPLLDADAEFVSLQREVREGDRDALSASGIHHFGADLQDFGDTAALLALVDVVVAVDTSVAHLAGAMARPTWLMLPWVAEWRWMLGRADSPWYPTMRLFRQPALADWPAVVQDVRTALDVATLP